MKNKINKILFLLIILTFSCSNKSVDYKNLTSSKSDIEFYKLKEVINYDDNTKISVSIPNNLGIETQDLFGNEFEIFLDVTPENEKNVFQYYFFEDNFGYMVSMDKLISRNTQKLNDKEYVDVSYNWFLNDLNGDLSEIERMLSPRMKDVRVVSLDGDIMINNKYFIKRVSYYNVNSLVGTDLRNVVCTEFHYVTIHNKKKYSLNVVYWGNDKSISDLIGLFNTIGGSLKFN